MLYLRWEAAGGIEIDHSMGAKGSVRLVFIEREQQAMSFFLAGRGSSWAIKLRNSDVPRERNSQMSKKRDMKSTTF